ncbi:MAG: 4-hydroxy-3-methylbut-2-enyl diphosphate reductase [Pseudomonadota bacterium]
MKVTVAKSAGFCFGVKRAIKIALDTVAMGRQVEMLGDIVHNEDVVRQIEASGIKKVSRLTKKKDTILLIRAHGAKKNMAKKAQSFGYTIVDATCPMVKEIHMIAEERQKEGYRIIIIGDKDHEEVEGIKGQVLSPALVIDSIDHIPLDRIKKIDRAAIVVQSTQNLDNVLKIVELLKPQIKDLKFYNTICKATTTRQDEIKILPLENDTVLVIGSKTSANTKRLYEIARSLNKRSYWIQTKDDIEREWFQGVATVGITAGASTPEATIKSVVAYVEALS